MQRQITARNSRNIFAKMILLSLLRSTELMLQHINNIKNLNKTAKNVIFMMGDGLGISTISAARIYLAQQRGLVGEEAALSWESLPYSALSKANIPLPLILRLNSQLLGLILSDLLDFYRHIPSTTKPQIRHRPRPPCYAGRKQTKTSSA